MTNVTKCDKGVLIRREQYAHPNRGPFNLIWHTCVITKGFDFVFCVWEYVVKPFFIDKNMNGGIKNDKKDCNLRKGWNR